MSTRVELRLGSRAFGGDDFLIWVVPDSGGVPACADIAGPGSGAPVIARHEAGPGADLLVGDPLAGAAAAAGAGLVCADPGRALALGVRPDGLVVDAGTAPPAARVEELAASGHPICATPAAGPPDEAGPGLLAAVSVYAWLGVRVFRVAGRDAEAVREVLDMVASIQGVRPPALSRRGLC